MDSDNLLNVLDYDLDIDFETAYEMINNDDQLDKIHHNHNHNMPFESEMERWNTSETRGQKRNAEDRTNGAPTESVGLASLEHTRSAGLLSEFESSAIENFLDSLISIGEKNDSSWPRLPTFPWGKHEENNHLQKALGGLDDLESSGHSTHFGNSAMPSAGANTCRPNHEVSRDPHANVPVTAVHSSATANKEISITTTGQVADKNAPALLTYAPAILKSPEIIVLDSEIPSEVRNNPVKRKKWKHVALEKKRRNAIKEYFDDLVELIQFPRPAAGESITSQSEDTEEGFKSDRKKRIKKDRPTDKRIPKHVLLNYLIEDMNSVLQANRSLEETLKSHKLSQAA
ncbi:LAME_0G08372g1_1 [Lachancea meyersii CBS 8951]|uniref:LAME_0G08372g1_1 n=1 Tax=Lachancea meyersii CBS 8951 TaxID=1266667 RepID=A0A1G4K874_9SACH|nr:LAME_0G08372g1_1 [Lachancea meyersii CBS 8951]